MNQDARRSERRIRNGCRVAAPVAVGIVCVILMMDPGARASGGGPGGHRDTPVHVYEWIGPHGVTHFSETPPPKSSRTRKVKHFTIRLAHVSRKQARADYLAQLAATRSMERGLRRLEAEQALAYPPPLRAGRSAPPGEPPVTPVDRYVRSGLGFYPDFGFYPPGLAPPFATRPAGPPPNLAPPSGGFGICGYEIACPPMGTIPQPPTLPTPPAPVPHFPPHP